MKLFQKLTTLVVPKKAEFAKRLAAKRISCAASPFLAGNASEGSAEYQLRVLGLGSIEYAFTPEATIVNILERYWEPSLQFMWGESANLKNIESEDALTTAKKKLNNHIGAIEYLLTKKPDAAVYLPEFCSLTEYLRYRIKAEHIKNPSVSAEDGFTDEFFRMQLKNHTSSSDDKFAPLWLHGSVGRSWRIHTQC